jgi:hypothetical protein
MNHLYNTFSYVSKINKICVYNIIEEACYQLTGKYLPYDVFGGIWDHLEEFPNDDSVILYLAYASFYHKGGRNRKNKKVKDIIYDYYFDYV